MTFDEYLSAAARIDELEDGTPERAELVERLRSTLMERPDEFWQEYLAAWNAVRPDSTRDVAERLIRTGAVHGLTRISDIRAILAADSATEQ